MKTTYAVFRVYSSADMPDPSTRSVFFGWSDSKQVIKAFLEQRDKKKYKVIPLSDDDKRNYRFYPDIENRDAMIDYVRLRIAETHEEIHFFSTLKETHVAEVRIQERFHEMCSIPDEHLLRMFIHIDPYYMDALELLGYQPKEVDMMFDCADYHDECNSLSLAREEIDDAYAGMYDSPPDDCERYEYAPGLMALTRVGDKLLYSVENFVSALVEDL